MPSFECCEPFMSSMEVLQAQSSPAGCTQLMKSNNRSDHAWTASQAKVQVALILETVN